MPNTASSSLLSPLLIEIHAFKDRVQFKGSLKVSSLASRAKLGHHVTYTCDIPCDSTLCGEHAHITGILTTCLVVMRQACEVDVFQHMNMRISDDTGPY